MALAAAAALGRGHLYEYAFAILGLAAALEAFAAGAGKRFWAAGGLFYSGGLLAAMIVLRQDPFFGLSAIVWLFALVWGTDVLAYFSGRLIGGPKLWPRVSPGKTWSGAIGGVVGGALLGLAAIRAFSSGPIADAPVLMMGLVVGAVSQGGDLFESSIKRRFDVKDSSHLIPGHGGAMDRLDGFIAAAIFAAIFGASRGLPSAAAGLFFWQ
jgi:phosphatidate cytidylyltransferase